MVKKSVKGGGKKETSKRQFQGSRYTFDDDDHDVYIAPTRPILSLFSEANIFKIFIYKLSKNDYCCLSS